MNSEQLNQLVRGFQPARVVLTAVELDLFAPLLNGPRSAAEIAAERNTHPPSTARVLDALASLDVLRKDGGRYTLHEDVRPFLDPAGPGYQGDILRHSLHLWDSWSQLTECVRSGGPAPRNPDRDEAATRRAFICGMANIARGSALELANAVDFTDDRRLLDVGGGPGTYALTLAEAYADLRATIFDFPEVLTIAREQIAAHGLEDRVSVQPGNALEDAYGKDYDTVLMSNLIHAFGAGEIRAAFRLAFDALRPGGRLLVKDFLVDESRTRPVFSALFGINMLVNTPHGDVYTRDELDGWLAEAGFGSVSALDLARNSTVLIAMKP